MRDTALPIALIVFGLGWFAREMGWLGGWGTVFAAILIVIGLSVLVTEGITKSSVVSAPALIYTGAVWLAYQHDLISARLVWPLGIVLLGACLLVARHPMIPPGRTTSPASDTPPSP